MILGEFMPWREAVIRLKVRGPAGPFDQIESVIDTGFTEYLTLPPSVIAALGLAFRSTTSMTLADGSAVQMNVHEAIVLWDGRERLVPVHEAASEPLLGIGLLYGSRLLIDVVDGGDVRIEPLPTTP
jgi:clan AA aspartic protease